jgi:uncharacterized phage protein gp47/JayE
MSLIDKGFGPTSVGFLTPSQADIKADHEERFIGELGPVDIDPRSDVGQEVGIHTGSDDDLWQLAAMLAGHTDPYSVTGDAQDRLYALLEVQRKAATKSSGTATLTGTAATLVPSGSVITSPDGVLRYATTGGATLAAATARAPSSSVATGAIRTNSGRIYVALVGGITGAGAGPSGSTYYPTVEVDGSVTWAFIGTGTAYATAAILAVEAGVVGGPAYGLTAIGTPVTGWNGVANQTDVVIGTDREEDEDYRARFFSEISLGLATVDAILKALLERSDVAEALVLENTEHTTNGDGLEAHSIEAVVRGTASSLAIATTIFNTKAAGIKTNGNVTQNVADIRGGLHGIKYTSPADLNIYLDVTVEADRSLWPSETLVDTTKRGTGRALAAILAFGTEVLKDGRDVDPSAIAGAVYVELRNAGFLSAAVKLGTSPNPSGEARIGVTHRQIARLDSTRTTVSVVYRTP